MPQFVAVLLSRIVTERNVMLTFFRVAKYAAEPIAKSRVA